MNADGILTQLFDHGGVIVNANDLSAATLAKANEEDRAYTDANGFGFVRLSREWLAAAQASAPS